MVVTVLASDQCLFEGKPYRVTVFMSDAGNLRPGSPVRLSGIKIGAVDHIQTSDDSRGSIRVEVSVVDSITLYETSELTWRPMAFW